MSSCQETSITGNRAENQPPKTFFTVDSINVPDDVRFASRVALSWWGVDPDGYVVGYEWAISEPGEEQWKYTERSDSTFLLPIQEGEKEADVRFTVRAIDNHSAHDPDPPSLRFPIENSAPTIRWTTTVQVPDTTYEFFSLGWNADDSDGEDDLSHVEFAINDTNTTWTQIDADIDFISLSITDKQDNTASANVFIGRSLRSSEIKVSGLNMNSENQVFIRAVDFAGAKSQPDSLTWFMKEQTSRVLVINDDDNVDSNQRLAMHIQLLEEAGINQVDLKFITEGQTLQGEKVAMSPNLHSPVDPTLNKLLARWDYIYWFSNNLDRHIFYGREILQEFLSNGGKLFTNIPTKNLPDGDPAFDVLPVERLASIPSGASSFIIWSNSEITPYGNENLPNILLQRTQTSVLPIIPPGGSRNLYEAPFEPRPSVAYDGSMVISTVNPDNNVAYFGINMWDFKDDIENLSKFVSFVINDILEFQN